ncbi:MAG: hypothetical protein HDS66_07965 [Bacteroidales bacterium]|nr:hypothetical protein [Bacteroidales bacterium]
MDITEIFDRVIDEQRSLDVADSEFRRMLVDDPELRRQYRAWCAEQEISEKRGFLDYCRQRFDEAESCWDALAPDEEDY